jgi:hypothetical protein
VLFGSKYESIIGAYWLMCERERFKEEKETGREGPVLRLMRELREGA